MSKLKSPMGGLVLDTKNGIKRGGDGGAVITPGNAATSRLYSALTYNQTELRMPPTGKLPDEKIAAFEKWMAAGAPDPREDIPETGCATPSAAKKRMDIETGRKWWAFQPVAPVPAPRLEDAAFAKAWPRGTIDRLIAAKLEQSRLQPSPEADRITLMQRASLDLTGLRPSYDELHLLSAIRIPSPTKS